MWCARKNSSDGTEHSLQQSRFESQCCSSQKHDCNLKLNFPFLSVFTLRQRFLEQVIENCGSTSRKEKLKGLCKTQGMERHECYETFSEFYEYVCISLEAIVPIMSRMLMFIPRYRLRGTGRLTQGTRSSGKFEDIRIHFHLFDNKE